MIGSEAVIAVLQKAISGESLAQSQYLCDAAMLRNLGLPSLADKMAVESLEERGHFTRFAERLVLLGSAPVVQPEPTVGHATVGALLENQLRLEVETVALYRAGVDICGAKKDPVSRRLFEDILIDEEHHVEFLEGQLELIRQVGGLGQYVQSYIAIPEKG